MVNGLSFFEPSIPYNLRDFFTDASHKPRSGRRSTTITLHGSWQPVSADEYNRPAHHSAAFAKVAINPFTQAASGQGMINPSQSPRTDRSGGHGLSLLTAATKARVGSTAAVRSASRERPVSAHLAHCGSPAKVS